MKRFFTVFATITIALSLLLGVFACSETEPEVISLDTTLLISEVVDAALPNGEMNEAIKSDLIRYTEKAQIETADAVAILTLMKEHAEELGVALTALHTNEYDQTAKEQTGDLLSLVATAVSADVAGDLYYAVMSDRDEDPAYTLSDCKKVATLYFTFYREIEGYSVSDILSGDLTGMGERQINTLLRSLASSLRAVKGLSENSKTYMLERMRLYSDTIDLPTEIYGADALSVKAFTDEALAILFDGYESFVSYGASFAANATAETFLGVKYDQVETTLYYGYNFDTWETTELTKEEYERFLETEQGFDTAFSTEKMTDGYYEDGVFHALSVADVALAKKAGRLLVAYEAYASLSPEEKSSFKQHTERLMQLLRNVFYDETLSEEITEGDIYTFDEMVTALSDLIGFDPKDGISATEETAATQAIAAYTGYLHGYLPNLY